MARGKWARLFAVVLCIFILSSSVAFAASEQSVQSFRIDVTSHSTWCDGSITKAAGDRVPVDETVKYTANGETKNTGKIEFLSSAKGTARFLGMNDVKLQAFLATAYLEIPVKGNGISDKFDLSFVTEDGAAGSWGQITGITTEWQVKRIYLKDLVTYMGTPNFDKFFYFDIYAENEGGATFWIGDMTFYSQEPAKETTADSTTESSGTDDTPAPANNDSSVDNTVPEKEQVNSEPEKDRADAAPVVKPVTHTIILPSTNSWGDGNIVKGPNNSVPLDDSVKYKAGDAEFKTAKITFTENEADGKYYIGLFFLDPNTIKMKSYKTTGYLEIPVKSDGKVKEIDIMLCSGKFENGDEQLAKVTLTGLTEKWQIKRIEMDDFVAANSKIDLDNLTSIQIRGNKGMVKDASVWFGNMVFWSQSPDVASPETGDADILQYVLFMIGALVLGGTSLRIKKMRAQGE